MLRCAEGAARHLAALRALPSGRALARVMAGAQAPVMLERSVRLQQGRVAHDRFLLSVPAAAAPAGLLAALDLTGPALAEACAALPGAAFVHVGVAGAERKLYLERKPGLAMDGSAGPPLHLAWKWRTGGEPKRDRYLMVPAEQVSARLAAVPAALRGALQATLAVLGAKPGWLFALDVLGDDNRRSLDLRCYDFGRCVGDLAAPLAEAALALGVPAPALNAALAVHRDDMLGHLALGAGRGGVPFFTVYAGAEPCEPALLA